MNATFSPNPFAPGGRAPWTVIAFGGGAPVKAALTELAGVKTKFLWKKQKSKETSGSVNTYQGQEWEEPVATFVCADGGGSTAEECVEDLWQLYQMMQPKPGQGTGTPPPATPAPGQTFAIGSPPNKASGSASGAATGNTVDDPAAASTSKAEKKDDPGPRPPTIAVSYPSLAWIGITACALAEWEIVGLTAENGFEVKVKIIPDKPAVKAGTGAMAAPKPAAPGLQFTSNAGTAGAPAAPSGATTPNAGGPQSITTKATQGAAGT